MIRYTMVESPEDEYDEETILDAQRLAGNQTELSGFENTCDILGELAEPWALNFETN